MVSQDYEIITINKEGNTEKSHCGAVMSSGQTQAPGAPRPLLEGPRGRRAGCEDTLADGLLMISLPSSILQGIQLKGMERTGFLALVSI